jgi:hypothetical protein
MHYFCRRGQRVSRSYYAPDESGWIPNRPAPRSRKDDEGRYARQDRRDRKRALGQHMRCTWLAQNMWSVEWTTCGGWVLGPSLGTWDQYPRSKKMRQREARQAKRMVERR